MKLTVLLSERIAEEEAFVVVGTPEDYAEYRQRVGVIAGLKEAMSISTEVKKLILGENDR
jgi:hypothetical protein